MARPTWTGCWTPRTSFSQRKSFPGRKRAFKRSDLAALHRIDQACFPPGISYSTRELDRFVSQAKSMTWVAEEGTAIAGFLILAQEPQKVGHIVTIDVIESRRRSGVGNLLMDAAEEWGAKKGLRLIYLETADNNHAAQSFYTARGYAKVDEVANYYSDGRAAWVMVKWL
jgi:[ribosomal protein S18]-alanine N-acetyltransferase